MPRPTKEQLEKINKLSQTALTEDQVFVFRSLSADTLPVERYGWFGKYDIVMSSNMLNALKKDYQKGVGLLASHNNRRLPFGRTFDAHVQVDDVDGERVETMYVDHYIVTHVKDDDGNKVPLQTEIGMTTQDIVHHISVGHTFDTSIGFSITEPLCSICKNDIRDYSKCSHYPGETYDVQVGDRTEQVRCDIIANNGEGIENSLVYAGAVNRATIQNSQSTESFSEGSVQTGVNKQDVTRYNVDDIKTVPLHSVIYCQMSKGNMELFTTTPERRQAIDIKEVVQMSATLKPETITAQVNLSDVVSKEEYNLKVSENQALSQQLAGKDAKIQEFEQKVQELVLQLAEKDEKIVSLSAKAELADQFTEDLIQETVKAGVQARGNTFNKERFEKYLRTLSVGEIKEELQALRNEFPGTVAEARVTSVGLQEQGEETVSMTKAEMRQEAARIAMQRFRTEGGDLVELTKQELAKLEEKLAN
jgi:hypothetical protein